MKGLLQETSFSSKGQCLWNKQYISIHVNIQNCLESRFVYCWLNSLPESPVIRFTDICCFTEMLKKTKRHGLSTHANYTDRLSDRRLSAKLVPTLADRGCRVVSGTISPQALIFGFLVQEPLFPWNSSSIIITRLSGPCSRPTTSQKESDSTRNRTRTSESVARNFDH
jgi:hypothetical protein